MSTNQLSDLQLAEVDPEPRLALDLGLREAEALRTWLLKAEADGATSLDDPLVNGALTKLGHGIDAVQSIVSIRRELASAGLDVAHLSDEQVRELGRRVCDAAMPHIRD